MAGDRCPHGGTRRALDAISQLSRRSGPAPGATVDKAELFGYLRRHLAPHKTPVRWFAVDEFPLTGSGEIQKFKLRGHWLQGERPEL